VHVSVKDALLGEGTGVEHAAIPGFETLLARLGTDRLEQLDHPLGR
jgi:hypothetical protein